MDSLRAALDRVVDIIVAYRDSLPTARVGPVATRTEVVESLSDTLPEAPASIDDVVSELVSAAEPGLMSSAGPRYFGFVVGGSSDAALAAEVLASGWDQMAFNEVTSPAALAFEDVAGMWLKQLFGIPASASAGFVTGAQAANTVGLTAARWSVLHDHGWDVGRYGLDGAPPVRVVVGAERHATIDRSVRLLGFGENAIEEVPVRSDGAMDAAALPAILAAGSRGPVVVCAQAGNVNSGAFDDLVAIADAARDYGAWVHVDGAFGLWAAASPRKRRLVEGIELADSWGCDGHKWLNVPYDSGYAFCSKPEIHATAMGYTASYLTGQDAGRVFGGGDFVPESSRRARGFATWAALRSLGQSGVEDLVDRCCELAVRFATGLDSIEGIDVVNEVILNQVLVRVGDAETTDRIAQQIQQDGTAWMSATTWQGERLLRISVSNWSTTEDDVDLSIQAIEKARVSVAAYK